MFLNIVHLLSEHIYDDFRKEKSTLLHNATTSEVVGGLASTKTSYNL